MAPEARGASFCRHIATLIRAAAVTVAAVVLLCAQAPVAEPQRWTEGKQPFFTLPTAEGAQVALGSQCNSVIVHVFATCCEPCRVELPALNRLIQRGRTSMKVLAVADVDASVQRFLETTPVEFPALLDRDRA